MGKLVIISGPSGVGKDTIIEKIIQRNPQKYIRSLSATTRRPRPDEVPGVSYVFVSEDEFKKMRDEGKFLEWALVHGYYYGTLIDDVLNKLKADKNVILKIDVQGAAQVKLKYPQALSIFIMPPNDEQLELRRRMRGIDDNEELRRIDAKDEIQRAQEYDYIVCNDELDRAVDEVIRLIEKAEGKS